MIVEKNNKLYWLILLLGPIFFIECSQTVIGNDPPGDQVTVFNAFWNELDRNYAFFDIKKNIDWDDMYYRYISEIRTVPESEIYDVYENILRDFWDGHLRIDTHKSSNYSFSGYLTIQSYPKSYMTTDSSFESFRIDVDSLVVKYLENYQISKNRCALYGNLSDSVGYLWLYSFINEFSGSEINEIFTYLSNYKNLIIDLRGNDGGYTEEMDKWLSRIVPKRIKYGYEQAKNGPGHYDFGEPVPLEISPNINNNYKGKILALISNDTYSAAEWFALAIKELGEDLLIGVTTSGTTGRDWCKELPNGWLLWYPTRRLLNNEKQLIEDVGVCPDIMVTPDPYEERDLRDEILEEAMRLIVNR